MAPVDAALDALWSARAAFERGEIRRAADAALLAGGLASSAARPDLLADAALAIPAVPDATTAAAIERLTGEALAALGAGDPARRARLLAQRSIALHHREELDGAGEALAAAESLVAETRDAMAEGLALHARALSIAGTDQSEALLDLAGRIGRTAAASAPDPTAIHLEMLGRAWRVDALMRLGRPIDAGLEIDALDVLAARSSRPLVRWNSLVARAGLDQATGRLAESQDHAREARDALPSDQRAQSGEVFVAQLLLAAMDRGVAPPEIEIARRPAIGGPLVAIAMTARFDLELGERARAQASWEGLRHRLDELRADRRQVPTLFAASLLAAAFDDAPSAALLRPRLDPFAGRMIVSSLGCVGPIDHALGAIAILEGRTDDAVTFAESALAVSTRGGFGPWQARSRHALAKALERRARAGDRARAAHEARLAAGLAGDLGMTIVAAEASALESALGADTRLSAREAEIAGLVADGASNRSIADALGLSERTIESHVQHILNKLGFHSRAQIAAWSAGQRSMD